MPIILDNTQSLSTAAKTNYVPAFFDKKLTGKGGRIGVLNERLNPVNIPVTAYTPAEIIKDPAHEKKHKVKSGDTETRFIPLSIIGTEHWKNMAYWTPPSASEMKQIGFNAASGVYTYLYMRPHNVILETVQTPGDQNNPSGSTIHRTTVCYQVFLCTSTTDLAAGTVPPFYRVGAGDDLYVWTAPSSLPYCYATIFTSNPKQALNEWLQDLNVVASSDLACLNVDAMNQYIDDYNTYDGVCRQSEEWQTRIDKVLDQYFENIATSVAKPLPKDVASGIGYLLRNMEAYNVPLDFYRSIYASIGKHFPADIASVLYKQNLNLLLSDTLHNLDRNKAALTSVPVPAQPVAIPAHYSMEQHRAITCHEPLVLIQAGAGCGKSSVILGRIDYMCKAGVRPQDIMVLSFTNAAADHINEKNPNVHSMTIASMIHTIYSANFPKHELSSLDTIINSVDIYYSGTDDVARAFRKLCIDVKNAESGAFVRMNIFVERYYDKVMEILTTIGQTSLELEIIICYQQIDNLQEPPEVQSRYLIVDEVQDNSIFEFVYTLKYVSKHNESLFIVGDCSQTLYEFRASDPKALNVLEGSGVFTTYQLQINYRSNQEILDFANVLLQQIDANQYANIQLRANTLSHTVTEQSFRDHVRFKYWRLGKLADLKTEMPAIFINDLKPYIDNCLAKGEQVAFLAFRRAEVSMIQTQLENLYGSGRTIANLVSERNNNSTVMSSFIRKKWDEVEFLPQTRFVDVLVRHIMDSLPYILSTRVNLSKAQIPIGNMIYKWSTENANIIQGWQQQYLAGRITEQEFFDLVKDNMLQFEIRNNAVRQSLVSQRNKENKERNQANRTDFVISTIHGAKGLEFENVVAIYQNSKALEEDKKRMYYVAFTRAMRSEFIVAFGTESKPRIEADYNEIITRLQNTAQTAPAAAAPAADIPDRTCTAPDEPFAHAGASPVPSACFLNAVPAEPSQVIPSTAEPVTANSGASQAVSEPIDTFDDADDIFDQATSA